MNRCFGMSLAAVASLLGGCGGDVDLHGTGAGGAASAGARHSTEIGSGVGIAMRSAAPLAVGGRPSTPPQSWGGEGPALLPGGWYASDVERPLGYREIQVSSAWTGCGLDLVASSTEQLKQPAIAPDGGAIAYASNESGRYQVHVRIFETGRVWRVTDSPVGATDPSWSRDSRRLVYVEGDHEVFPRQGRRVGVVELATGAQRFVEAAADSELGFFAPIFAGPERVLISDGATLHDWSLADGALRPLRLTERAEAQPREPSLSPDGTRIVFADFSCPFGSILSARLDGSSGEPCTSGAALGAGIRAGSPAWGPLGSIAVTTARGLMLLPENGGAGVAGVAYDFVNPTRNPAWAPADFSFECKW